MKITKEKLREVAENFLEILAKREINSLESLKKAVQKSEIFPLERNSSEYVSYTIRPSEMNTSAHTLSYNILSAGIPIELKINPILGYSRIIIKYQGKMGGYSILSEDNFRNIIQNKIMLPDFQLFLEELKKLQTL